MNRLKHFCIFLFLRGAMFFRSALSESDTAVKFLFRPGYEGIRWRVGKWKAWRVFEFAKTSVPAYADFLTHQGFSRVPLIGWDPDLTVIPSMEKENYIKAYSLESRCVGGSLPTEGVVIDESSGTSGTPNNWVRGPKERQAVKRMLQVSLHALMGRAPIFFINAFALGPWATGMNVSMSLVDVSILKSTGPDVKKIENTLTFFGPKYRYVIAGYPPFLKGLIDTAQIDWKAYDITVFYGGEGMSEGMRAYLGKAFKRIYGSYGASDLEINIAAENDFTIALRTKLAKHKKLYAKIVRHHTLPMVFQYNPLDYYIETNDQGELLVTLCRISNIAPKVRYNIHDLGHVMRFSELKEVLQKFGMEISDIGPMQTDLPLLFHYGRSDMAVGFYGCKITPTEIEDILFRHPQLATQLNTFSLITTEDERMNKVLILALEMSEGAVPIEDVEALRTEIFESLKKVNQDFRESSKMVPDGLAPRLEIHPFGQGPFAGNDIRLKKNYIQVRNT